MAKYRILQRGSKFKIQERSWFTWCDIGIQSPLSDNFYVSYYNSIEEAQAQIEKLKNKYSESDVPWKVIELI